MPAAAKFAASCEAGDPSGMVAMPMRAAAAASDACSVASHGPTGAALRAPRSIVTPRRAATAATMACRRRSSAARCAAS